MASVLLFVWQLKFRLSRLITIAYQEKRDAALAEKGLSKRLKRQWCDMSRAFDNEIKLTLLPNRELCDALTRAIIDSAKLQGPGGLTGDVLSNTCMSTVDILLLSHDAAYDRFPLGRPW